MRIRENTHAWLAEGEKYLCFICPGCAREHCVIYPDWDWNGSYALPTFTPSILTGTDHFYFENRCHSFVTEGQIHFLEDCHHELAGKVVDLPEVE